MLLDIMMPAMTGLTLFQKIEEQFPLVPVIFVTAVDDLTLAVAHLKRGACDYLVKPVTRTRLQQAVEEALDRSRSMLEQNQHLGHLENLVMHQAKALDNRTREVNALNVALLNRASKPNGSRSPSI